MKKQLNPTPESILVRAPNWLGDTIMSAGFFHKLADIFPDSEIDVIVDEKLSGMVKLIPVVSNIYGYNRHDRKGFHELYRFSRNIALKKRYDLFFSLPDSFSSAFMGYLTRSRQRIGYKNDLRTPLLTHAYRKPCGLHRVEEYAFLLNPFTPEPLTDLNLKLRKPQSDMDLPVSFSLNHPVFVYHMNSEAESRRVPLKKAASIAKALIASMDCHLILTGTANDAAYNKSLESLIASPGNVTNLAGKTTLYALADLMTRVHVVISTDSGTAHLANSLGAKLLVLWGPADHTNTAPYGAGKVRLMRDVRLACIPCVKNVCRFGTNQCYLNIEPRVVLENMRGLLDEKTIADDSCNENALV